MRDFLHENLSLKHILSQLISYGPYDMDIKGLSTKQSSEMKISMFKNFFESVNSKLFYTYIFENSEARKCFSRKFVYSWDFKLREINWFEKCVIREFSSIILKRNWMARKMFYASIFMQKNSDTGKVFFFGLSI